MTITYTNLNNIITAHKKILVMLLLIVCILCGIITPDNAYAADPAATDTVCTADQDGKDTPEFAIITPVLISAVIEKIKEKLLISTYTIYLLIVSNPEFLLTIQMLLALYVVFYGILFMTGMVEIRLNDFVMRVIKMSIVMMLISADSWNFFFDYVSKFFNDGTDEIINFITSYDGIPDDDVATMLLSGLNVFRGFDSAVSKIISGKMFVTLMATSLTMPFGPIFFIMLVISIWSFLRALLTATGVYVMSLTIRALLLGLAPIFIPTILFQRTRHIFDNWINQLVSVSLQPILLFVFFSFFVKLMEGSIDNILLTPICFTDLSDSWRGTPHSYSFWRFMTFTENGWEPTVKDLTIKDGFPISVIGVLTFFILAELTNRFNDVVIQIAQQMANASTNLTGLHGAVSDLTKAASSSIGKMKSNIPSPKGT